MTGALGVAWDSYRALRGGGPAIAARQARRLEELVRHARRHSRYYAQLYRDLPPGPVGPRDLPALPAVHKSTLMRHFEDWVTDPEVTRAGVEAFVADLTNVGTDFLGRYVVFTTSGSTAEPALLIQDRQAVAVMMGLAYARSAGVLPFRLLPRILARGARQAAIFASGGHFLTATMFARQQRRQPYRRRYAKYFSILDPLPELVAELNEFQPVLISTYASALSVLADEQQAGRLRIAPLVITSGGEMLLPGVRARAERIFGAVVVETYNASEATPLSLPCRRGRMHVNADWFIVEPVDEAGNPVPAGQRSETVLVTNLANYVQPVIRYELGDSVVIGTDPCECGSPLPTITTEGRTDEILRVPAVGGGQAVLLPLAISTVVEETPGVRQYQILQTGPAALSIRLAVDPGRSSADVGRLVRQRLTDFLCAQGAAPEVSVGLSPDPPTANPRSGKLRHVLKTATSARPR